MQIFRLLRILRVVLRYRLDRLLPGWKSGFPGPRSLFRLLPGSSVPVAAALRQALEELGPVFVKFGQQLSTRRDLLGDDLVTELEKLHDQVPPFDPDEALELIASELESDLDEVFEWVRKEPLASASVAQVHAARLKTGEEVVVKVIRPGVERVIQKDLRLMRTLAGLVTRFYAESRRLRPVDLVEDYARTIGRELDLTLEAGNTAKLRSNWLGSGKLYVPLVYWDLTRRGVMVMERIYGTPANEVATLQAAGVDLKKLGVLGVDIFFTQVFRQNFFHADMHPGNVFIDTTDPGRPSYIGLDCAIVGSLTEADQAYLAKNLLAFFNRDYHEVARLHLESGWVSADTNVEDFEHVIRAICEPIFNKPMKDISFGRFLLALFQAARRFDMEVQPQLVLLQKTLLNIEGMGRDIYPDLDLWQTAKPFLERWMRDRIGPAGLLCRLYRQSPQLLEELPNLPLLVVDSLKQQSQLADTIRQHSETGSRLLQRLEQEKKRRRWWLVCGLGLAAGALLLLPEEGVNIALMVLALAAVLSFAG